MILVRVRVEVDVLVCDAPVILDVKFLRTEAMHSLCTHLKRYINASL